MPTCFSSIKRNDVASDNIQNEEAVKNDHKVNGQRRKTKNKKKSQLDKSGRGWLKETINELDQVRDTCPICQKYFPDYHRMVAHVRNVHKKPFKCDMCRRQFFSQEVLDKHRLSHGGSFFECNVCHLKYKREETMIAHYVRLHSDIKPEFTCDHCGKTYKLKQDLMLHINQVHMCPYQICRFCGKAVKNVKAHEWHHANKLKRPGEQDRLYPCSLCFKKFRSETKLENHLIRHVQRYECDQCGLTFPGPGQLMNHKSKHRPGVNCFFCQKFFSSRSNYYQHVLMHAKVRPYKCGLCSLQFTQRSTLVRHHKTHSEPVPDVVKQVPIADLARKVLKSFKNMTPSEASEKLEYVSDDKLF